MMLSLLLLVLAQDSHELPALATVKAPGRNIPEGEPVLRSVLPGTALEEVVGSLPSGSTLKLEPGIYAGPLHIDRPMRLIGSPGAALVGPGKGSVLIITADDVQVEGMELRGGGHNATDGDAGIIVLGDRFLLRGLKLTDVLVGIDLRQAHHGKIQDVNIEGSPNGPMGMRGDGIRLWESTHNQIEGNHLSYVRDMVIWYSNHNTVENNVIEHSRYGVHFMHSDQSEVRNNHFSQDVVGVFVMYSTDIRLEGNVVANANGAAGMGFGCKESDTIALKQNQFLGNTTGLYLDSCPHRIGGLANIQDNLLAYNHVGLRFNGVHAGAEFRKNRFHENSIPVVVTGGGDAQAALFEGNRWSDYEGYDLDQDGFGDLPYAPRKVSRAILERRPAAAFFNGSPAAQLLDFLAIVFPMWAPPPLMEDRRPLMGSGLSP